MAKRAHVDPDTCIGCELCANLCPDVFYMEGGLAVAKDCDCDTCELEEVASQCPVDAISVEDV